MSLVTTFMLSLPVFEEDRVVPLVNQWMADHNHGPLPPVGAHPAAFGGSKAMQPAVYIGSYNYFETDEFVDFLKSIDWPVNHYGHRSFDEAQLFVREESERVFSERLHIPGPITHGE